MSAMEEISYSQIQAKVFDFALEEMVLSKRSSFSPLWTVDSWAKFLIWMALNCGLSGERKSLENFAEALGPNLTSRMRKIFFERILEDMNLYLIADPIDKNVLILPVSGARNITIDEATEILKNVGITDRVDLDSSLWKLHDSIMSIPWKT